MKILTENLSKRFSREWIFKNFSFTFEKNQIYAVIGPNGSGKSTLLQVIWGQLPPSSGEFKYSLNNRAIAPENIFKYVSIATPYMEVIEEFTLDEMIRFHFKFKKLREDRTLTSILENSGLEAAREKRISNFSSGMRQRLKLLLAFNSDVPVLFLDEPTSNLDKNGMNWYLHLLQSVQGKCLTIIASNQEHEYPQNAIKISLLDFK
ncbi:MAG: ABC transporter ATP-binding protein [Flammeovirgaceae bacterium]|nr:ABC transporter ATP-binding protein [Flammeovirgaceae bacterium]